MFGLVGTGYGKTAKKCNKKDISCASAVKFVRIFRVFLENIR